MSSVAESGVRVAPIRRHSARFLTHPVVRAIARRFLLAVPLLFVVSALSFVLVSLIPGNAAKTILGPESTPEQQHQLERQLGLDQPLYVQYWHWLRHALTGDLGTSVYNGQKVTQEISQRLPVTLSLVIGALIVMLVVGVAIGVFSAVRGGALGRFVDGISLVGYALPVFWVGAILIEFFAVRAGFFPAVGYVPMTQDPVEWLHSLVLPVIALSLNGIAILARQTREAMLDVMASEHVRMSWASGIPPRSIFFTYSFKNAAIRVITILGLQTAALLSGTVLVENVFALPGLGALAVDAAIQQDIPVVLAVTILFTLIIIVVNLVVDLAYTWLDPRVRIE
jgi:peptide/nickel transport system permease protein